MADPEASRSAAAILVVNDEPLQLAAMEATLAGSGYRIVVAASGRAALRRVLAEDFAVIVMDVRMPDMDGFETAHLIRSRPRSQSTPILFATAQAVAPEDARRGYALGAVDYLVAPFDASALRAKVAVFVELFERTQEVRSLAADLEAGLAQARHLNAELEREVAERRRAEIELADKARQLEAAISELESYDYSVAHDLRTPLRAIHGYASLIAEAGGGLSAEARDYLDRIVKATQRMSGLIDALLSLSRAVRAEMHRTTVDLSALAIEILDDLRKGAPARRAEVTVAPNLCATGDPALLHVVLQNLLDNAWKFTRTRDTARIEVGSQPAGIDVAYFVRDNGVGFDMHQLPQLFQTFQRLHRDAEFEGTGVGLVTVKRIVARHGGRVWVDAAPDRGAAFYFTLPLEPAVE
jgi:hypothetical protein